MSAPHHPATYTPVIFQRASQALRGWRQLLQAQSRAPRSVKGANPGRVATNGWDSAALSGSHVAHLHDRSEANGCWTQLGLSSYTRSGSSCRCLETDLRPLTRASTPSSRGQRRGLVFISCYSVWPDIRAQASTVRPMCEAWKQCRNGRNWAQHRSVARYERTGRLVSTIRSCSTASQGHLSVGWRFFNREWQAGRHLAPSVVRRWYVEYSRHLGPVSRWTRESSMLDNYKLTWSGILQQLSVFIQSTVVLGIFL